MLLAAVLVEVGGLEELLATVGALEAASAFMDGYHVCCKVVLGRKQLVACGALERPLLFVDHGHMLVQVGARSKASAAFWTFMRCQAIVGLDGVRIKVRLPVRGLRFRESSGLMAVSTARARARWEATRTLVEKCAGHNWHWKTCGGRLARGREIDGDARGAETAAAPSWPLLASRPAATAPVTFRGTLADDALFIDSTSAGFTAGMITALIAAACCSGTFEPWPPKSVAPSASADKSPGSSGCIAPAPMDRTSPSAPIRDDTDAWPAVDPAPTCRLLSRSCMCLLASGEMSAKAGSAPIAPAMVARECSQADALTVARAATRTPNPGQKFSPRPHAPACAEWPLWSGGTGALSGGADRPTAACLLIANRPVLLGSPERPLRPTRHPEG